MKAAKNRYTDWPIRSMKKLVAEGETQRMARLTDIPLLAVV